MVNSCSSERTEKFIMILYPNLKKRTKIRYVRFSMFIGRMSNGNQTDHIVKEVGDAFEFCTSMSKIPGIYFLSSIWHIFLEFWVLNLLLVWLYKYFDLSVTDESYVDETRVWRTKL